jgi:hypothetical protein
MLVTYCTTAKLSLALDNLTKASLSTCLKPYSTGTFRTINISNSTNNLLVIIAFREIIITKIECQSNIIIISPKVVFETESMVNLSNLTEPKTRINNSMSDFYGLAGFAGLPGYNLSVYSANIIGCPLFTSTGSSGGDGQYGSPGGVGGFGGKGGLYIVNNQIVVVGNQGKNGKDNGVSRIGLEESITNSTAIHIDIDEFKQIIYQGIIESDLDKDEIVKSFFLL